MHIENRLRELKEYQNVVSHQSGKTYYQWGRDHEVVTEDELIKSFTEGETFSVWLCMHDTDEQGHLEFHSHALVSFEWPRLYCCDSNNINRSTSTIFKHVREKVAKLRENVDEQ